MPVLLLKLLCFPPLIAAAYLSSDCGSAFLLKGLGFCLLLDCCCVRFLPWPAPFSWQDELKRRATAFFVGAVAVYVVFLRKGGMSVREAVFWGAAISLAALVLSVPARLAHTPRALRRARWVQGAAVVLFIALTPVLGVLHLPHSTPYGTPGDLGFQFRDLRLASADGTRIAAWFIARPQARGVVVFCHGHGGNRSAVLGVLPTLRAVGLSVLAIDFRAHGDSDGHTSTFGPREVEDLAAAVAFLRVADPDQPLFLMGFSMGAAVCLQALPHIEGIRGVWSEGAYGDFRLMVRHRFRYVPSWLRTPLLVFYEAVGRYDAGITVDEVLPVEAVRGATTPIFFCHGRDDMTVPFSETEALYAACAGPKYHWWVDGGEHTNLRYLNQAEYLHRLGSFFDDALNHCASK